VVLIKLSLEMSRSWNAFLKSETILSTNSLGFSLFFSAISCIFWPCSSVPVKKNTSSPKSLCHLASTSAAIVVYAPPR